MVEREGMARSPQVDFLTASNLSEYAIGVRSSLLILGISCIIGTSWNKEFGILNSKLTEFLFTHSVRAKFHSGFKLYFIFFT